LLDYADYAKLSRKEEKKIKVIFCEGRDNAWLKIDPYEVKDWARPFHTDGCSIKKLWIHGHNWVELAIPVEDVEKILRNAHSAGLEVVFEEYIPGEDWWRPARRQKLELEDVKRRFLKI